MNELKQELIRSLVGDSYDAHRLMDATREFPGKLERLRDVILPKTPNPEDAYDVYSECPDVIDCLEYYLSLGAAAQERMPGIYHHLNVCDRCSSSLAALKASTLSEPKSTLLLAEQGWKWFTKNSDDSVKLSEIDVAQHHQIGAWSLRPSRSPATTFSSESHAIHPLSLSIDLPDNAAEVLLHVTSAYQSTEHRLMWQLLIEILDPAKTPILYVGLGDAISQTIGYRALRLDRAVDFQIAPPVHTFYCLYFEWKSVAGQWQTKIEKLPLLYKGD